MAEDGSGEPDDKDGSRAVVVVLCGLPAAGKTTLAWRLQAWLEEEGGARGRVVRTFII
jgi:adenylylsulfate kinase-like enzyme